MTNTITISITEEMRELIKDLNLSPSALMQEKLKEIKNIKDIINLKQAKIEEEDLIKSENLIQTINKLNKKITELNDWLYYNYKGVFEEWIKFSAKSGTD